MELDRLSCDRARRARDARFDGRFFVAVTTTGIYCRPICPARSPKDENVRYFPSAAAAEAAGFRPCLRCRPESAPGSPAWNGTSGVVSRALRLIGEGALDGDGVERLAERVGVTGRHLRRLFRQHLGATPLEVALTRRVHFAKKLLDETGLGLEQIAFASGFGSLRRFNARIRRTFRRTPTELRRRARSRLAAEPECYRFRLDFRAPYDWDGMMSHLESRAIGGVESIDDSTYRRTIAVEGKSGVIEVARPPGSPFLALSVRFPDPEALLLIVERVRRVFDLGADPAVVAEHLALDPMLRDPLESAPGIRIPGAWDGLELAVAAILGRSVTRRVVEQFGCPVSAGHKLDRLFPQPEALGRTPLERAGAPPDRAETVRQLAREAASGRDLLSSVRAVPGIPPRIAEYVRMCALGEPDAFPSLDPALRRSSEKWRPWRAYAFLLLRREGLARGGEMREWIVVLSLLSPSMAQGEAGRVVELRSYNLKPGTRDRFHQRFLDEALPMLERWKVDVVAYGPSLHDADSYFLTRSFPSLEERERIEESFYGSEEWRQGPREAVLADIVSYTTVVVRVDEATLSGLRRMGEDSMSSDLAELLELNEAYIHSVQTSDVRRFEEILAEDFLCSLPDGSLLDRKRFLEQTARPVSIAGLQAHEVNVRLMGDFAIVHARTTYTTAEGRGGSGRYTDVWARRNGRWLAVSAHVTRN